ncbi:amino acid adenylation domain-containing protein, partial [Fulvivirga kasyanovii]|nr:amino acid adenylation domain-containing protein [Fulvivirga kasyanovii]
MINMFMHPTDHIKKLRDIGVTLVLHDEGLKVIGLTKNLTPDLLQEIRDNKQELISFLKRATSAFDDKNIKKASRKPRYPLGQQQEILYLINKLDPHSVSYNLPSCYEFKGQIDVDKIESIFQLILERHNSLRTYFEENQEGVFQYILESIDFRVERGELKDVESYYPIIDSFIKPFNLKEAPLLRVKVVKLGKEKGLILFDTHHIVVDGRSQELIVQEFISLYNGLESRPVKFQFTDYSEWQRSNAYLAHFNEHRAYWLNEYEDRVEYLKLATLKASKDKQEVKGNYISFVVGNKEINRVDYLVRRLGVTRFTVLFSVYSAFLYLISRQSKFAVGTPSNGRMQKEWDGVIGMFVNTLAIKMDIDKNHTFESFVLKVSEKISSALDNQSYPVEEIAKELKIPVEKGKSPLFNIWFFYNESFDSSVKLADAILTKITHRPKYVKWDLILECIERNDKLEFLFSYPDNRFSQQSISYYVQLFKRIFKSVLRDSGQLLNEIALLNKEEKASITVDFNNTEKEIDKNKTVIDLIIETALKFPNKTAVKYGDQSISYLELNRQSDCIAKRLLNDGVSKNDIVGIMLERSIELITTILGVLKSGAGYLPLNPTDPVDRISFILENSNCKLLVTESAFSGSIEDERIKIITSDQLAGQNEVIEPQNVNLSKVDKTAYVIYTSGTTGLPKGVNVGHGSLNNYVNWASKQYVNDQRCDFALYTSVFFDMVITSIFVPLISGNCIHIYRHDDNDFLLDDILIDNQVQVIKLTPTQLGLLVEQDELKKKLTNALDSSLMSIIVGGEYFSAELASKASQFFPKSINIYNEYGPTEATVGCMIHRFSDKDKNKASVPIGKPIDNVQLFVLDDFLRPLPFGIPGELYISGEALALGYISSEKLNNEKFIESPFIKGRKLYKTGDIVVMSQELILEYIGRVDDQVKIRGYRVETGEIENNILKLRDIDSCAVITKNDSKGEAQLHAYFISKRPVDQLTLRTELSRSLPAYMIPSIITPIDKLPTTASGKVDKAALAEYSLLREGKQPLSELEKRMFLLWKEVLGVDTFGIDEDFYHIGGDSIRAIRLISKINKEFKIKIGVKDLFNNPTIEAIIRVLLSFENNNPLSKERNIVLNEFNTLKEAYLLENADKLEVEDVFPVSDIQVGMIFHTLKDPESTFYHDQMVHQAYYENFDIGLFSKAFDLLCNKHASLRTFFDVLSDETPVQVVLEKVYESLGYYDIKHLEVNEQKKYIQEYLDNDLKSPFDVF